MAHFLKTVVNGCWIWIITSYSQRGGKRHEDVRESKIEEKKKRNSIFLGQIDLDKTKKEIEK